MLKIEQKLKYIDIPIQKNIDKSIYNKEIELQK